MEIKGLSMTDQMRMMRGVDSIFPTQKTEIPNSVNTENKVSFSDYLEKTVSEANQLGLESDKAIQRAIDGTELNPHAAVIALQKADISFRLMLSVKSRLEQAYEQLVRMPIG